MLFPQSWECCSEEYQSLEEADRRFWRGREKMEVHRQALVRSPLEEAGVSGEGRCLGYPV